MTKAILNVIANQVACAESLEEAYIFIAEAANVEGLEVPSYEEAKNKFSRLIAKNRKLESGE